jgi:CBS domain containing-hemolysin-like protein
MLWPSFRPEPYLRLGDLERAVELSTTDAALLEQEQRILQHIVLLSEIRADELMRPRTRFTALRPPVSLAAIEGPMTVGGYLLFTEPDSDEVASAIDLSNFSSVPDEHLEYHAQPVVCVPWCATVAAALEAMRQRDRQVAAVVNELGETIGVLTFDDILDTIFTRRPSRSQRLLKRVPIRRHAPGVWHVTGMTSLRRLARHFDVPRPPSKSVTVSGVVQEVLERFPQPGDTCRWGPFQFKVLDAPDRGQLIVELTMPENQEGEA